MASWVVVLLVGSARAATGDTGGETTGTTGPTGTTATTGDTAGGQTAAQLANDPGGTPCEDGCSTGAGSAFGWLWVPALVVAARRRGQAEGTG